MVAERGVRTVREFIPVPEDRDLWTAAQQHCARTGMTTWMVGATDSEAKRAAEDAKVGRVFPGWRA